MTTSNRMRHASSDPAWGLSPPETQTVFWPYCPQCGETAGEPSATRPGALISAERHCATAGPYHVCRVYSASELARVEAERVEAARA